MEISEIIEILNEVNDLYPLDESSESYRKLVKIYHPDATTGNEEIFKGIAAVKNAGDEQLLDKMAEVADQPDKVNEYLKMYNYLSDNKEPIKDEREGKSKELTTALNNQYALAQTHKKCVETILNKSSSQELTNIEKQELLTLFITWNNQIKEFYNSDLSAIQNNKEKQIYETLVHKSTNQIENTIKEINTTKKSYKSTIIKIIDKTWELFKDIITAKLPMGLLKAIAYSNPFTALVAENWDIISDTTKNTWNTIKGDIK